CELREAQTLAAVGFGNVHARQAQLLTEPFPDTGLVALGSLHQPPHLGDRRGLLEEAAHGAAQLVLLFGRAPAHARFSHGQGAGAAGASSTSSRLWAWSCSSGAMVWAMRARRASARCAGVSAALASSALFSARS